MVWAEPGAARGEEVCNQGKERRVDHGDGHSARFAVGGFETFVRVKRRRPYFAPLTGVLKFANNNRKGSLMPHTKVIFYKDDDGSVPVLDWLKTLPSKAVAKCLVKIERLGELGHELRRPEADLLRDQIYELRIGLQGINYRVLYFFHGEVAAVLAHGIIKQSSVPPKEIERTIERKRRYELNPQKHTHEEPT